MNGDVEQKYTSLFHKRPFLEELPFEDSSRQYPVYCNSSATGDSGARVRIVVRRHFFPIDRGVHGVFLS